MVLRWPIGVPILVFCLALFAGCAVVPVRPDGSPEPVPVDALMKQGARTMWIAPHPDDELFPGPLLARSSKFYGNPLHFLILTHGDGGECGLARGCDPDLGTVRGEELKRSAALFGASLEHAHFFNAPLPVSSFPSRADLWKIWQKEGDPVRLIAHSIRAFKPDLVFTFDPDHGATGHPEHQLSARLAVLGMRMAADPAVDLDGLPPHRVGRVYQMVNRYWPLVLFGFADPPPVTEEWDTEVPCTEKRNCLDFMLRAIREHRTQHNDMQKVSDHRGAFETLSLRQIDPYTQIWDPAAED